MNTVYVFYILMYNGRFKINIHTTQTVNLIGLLVSFVVYATIILLGFVG